MQMIFNHVGNGGEGVEINGVVVTGTASEQINAGDFVMIQPQLSKSDNITVKTTSGSGLSYWSSSMRVFPLPQNKALIIYSTNDQDDLGDGDYQSTSQIYAMLVAVNGASSVVTELASYYLWAPGLTYSTSSSNAIGCLCKVFLLDANTTTGIYRYGLYCNRTYNSSITTTFIMIDVNIKKNTITSACSRSETLEYNKYSTYDMKLVKLSNKLLAFSYAASNAQRTITVGVDGTTGSVTNANLYGKAAIGWSNGWALIINGNSYTKYTISGISLTATTETGTVDSVISSLLLNCKDYIALPDYKVLVYMESGDVYLLKYDASAKTISILAENTNYFQGNNSGASANSAAYDPGNQCVYFCVDCTNPNGSVCGVAKIDLTTDTISCKKFASTSATGAYPNLAGVQENLFLTYSNASYGNFIVNLASFSYTISKAQYETELNGVAKGSATSGNSLECYTL